MVHYAKAKMAMEWVARGLAVVIGEKQIRMVTPQREVVLTSDSMKSSGQNDAYELSAIEPHRHLVQGGRVNGKRRQMRIEPFSGAHVGHQ
jgi:hypothetical protein